MNEKTEVDLALEEFNKYFWINFLLGVISIGAVTCWIIGQDGIIDYAGQIPLLKIFIKKLNSLTAFGILLSSVASIVASFKQLNKLYKVVYLMNEQMKNNKTSN